MNMNPHGCSARRGLAKGADGVEYEGITVQKPKAWQFWMAEITGGFLWFWLLYTVRHDWKAIVVSFLLSIKQG